MANMSLKKVAMPEQDPNVRNKTLKKLLLDIQKRWQWKKQLVA